MKKDDELYFLQPTSDQAISVARILSELDNVRINAVILNGESQPAYLSKLYNKQVYIKDYSELPIKCTIVPFGAQSTEKMLVSGDVIIGDVMLTQDALNVYEKPKFLNFCQKHNLPIPTTLMKIDELIDSDFPIFYKQKYEQGGGMRGVAKSFNEIPPDGQDELIYQELITSPGTYGVGFLAEKGMLVTNYCHFEESSYPASGGSAIVIKKVENNRLLELTKLFIQKSNYSGWGLAEFKWCDKRNDFVFMEINAKFWASCELAFISEPTFIKRLFNVDNISKKNINGIVYVNRAFSLGFIKGIYILYKNRSLYYVVYPQLYRAILKGLFPTNVLRHLKKFKKR